MKKLKEVQKEKSDLIIRIQKDEALKERENKSLRRNLTFLNKIILLSEKNPNEDFLKSEQEKLIKQIDLINKNFGTWRTSTPECHNMKNPKLVYENECELKKKKQQLLFVNFILK